MLLATLSHEFVAQICRIRRRQEGDLCAPWLLKQEENEIWLKDQEQWKLPSQPMQAGEQGPLWDLPSTRHRWGRRQARRKCRSTDRTPGCDMIHVSTSDGQPILKCSLAKGKISTAVCLPAHPTLFLYFSWCCLFSLGILVNMKGLKSLAVISIFNFSSRYMSPIFHSCWTFSSCNKSGQTVIGST